MIFKYRSLLYFIAIPTLLILAVYVINDYSDLIPANKKLTQGKNQDVSYRKTNNEQVELYLQFRVKKRITVPKSAIVTYATLGVRGILDNLLNTDTNVQGRLVRLESTAIDEYDYYTLETVYAFYYTDIRISVVLYLTISEAQVFVVDIKNKAPSHWSRWKKPDYLDHSEILTDIITQNLNVNDFAEFRDFKISDDLFEMRYKLELLDVDLASCPIESSFKSPRSELDFIDLLYIWQFFAIKKSNEYCPIVPTFMQEDIVIGSCQSPK